MFFVAISTVKGYLPYCKSLPLTVRKVTFCGIEKYGTVGTNL